MANLNLGTKEGQFRQEKKMDGKYGGRRSGKKNLDGGFGGQITSFLTGTNQSFWDNLCETEGHRYHSCTGLCVRCNKHKDE